MVSGRLGSCPGETVVSVKRLGLIVRCDFGGGLANQTMEMAAHLDPDAILIVMMGAKGRGTPERPERYINLATDVYGVDYQHADAGAMQEFLSKIDVLLSVETFYEPFLLIRGGELGIERVLYGNPELLNFHDPAEQADRYLWPAPWMHPFPVAGEILPWPCSTDIEPRGEINWPPRFVHVGAPAMLDRNGTEVVVRASALTTEHRDLYFYGSAKFQGDPPSCTYWKPSPEDHWDLYRDADLLVLPRRYGCLSMTMLEAAAMGVPTLTTDLLPQSDWFRKWHPWLTIPPGPPTLHSMKGSQHHLGLPGVGVYDPRPEDLALAMDRLAERDDVLDALRVEVRTWAEARSWDRLLPAWNDALRS